MLSGTGATATSVFTLEPGIAIFELKHSGASNFAVWLLDANGAMVELLANTIGSYFGQVGVGVDPDALVGATPGQHLLNVEAGGSWEVTVRQPRWATAPGKPVSLEGVGDAVAGPILLEEGLARFSFTHDGSLNFAVWLYSADGAAVDLLVNDIGPYNGSKAVGVQQDSFLGAKPGIHVLFIKASRNWTASIE